nr:RHS repeat-associated core domain-containing protein [Anaerocolumna cellulosilytica]
MEYYADGLRAGKYTEAGSDLYVYDLSGYLVAEAKNAATITANYVWGPDRVLSKKETGGGEYYYLYNGHGDVVQIVDRNGNVVNNYKYDEWGNILESTETISNPFKYAGEIYDEETGLYYLRARYYDPALGRFLNEDSVEGQVNNPLSLNLYTYCYNNPLIYIDPTGNTAKDFFTGLANALDDNLTGGALNWLVSKMLKVNHDYRYESGVDYYTGRVVGDVLSMLGGSGSIVSGIGTIVTSITGGGAITVSSGGTLVLGGGAIVVEGVIAGTAQVTYGGLVIATASGNFNNDVNNLKKAYSAQNSINNVLSGAAETTSSKGVARNYEKSGGYNQTLRDFDSLNPINVKNIQTQYGLGKVGKLSDGTTVVARPGSKTGGPTLEITVSNNKVYKIRY